MNALKGSRAAEARATSAQSTTSKNFMVGRSESSCCGEALVMMS